jgi:spermidine synthase
VTVREELLEAHGAGPDGPAYDEVARAASARGEVVLRRRRADAGLELRVNGVFVMDSQQTATEEALAEAALIRHPEPSTVLVGGLGLGYTLRAVLDDHRVRRVTVVEVEESVVGWLRDGTVPRGPELLADDRVHVVVADVRLALAEARPASYDLVLLDVDNGPGFLVYDDNRAVYGTELMCSVRDALRPGGLVVVWSADEAPALHQVLRTVFGSATAHAIPVRLQGRDERYWLHLAGRPLPAPEDPDPAHR